jgi:hypothetical protein
MQSVTQFISQSFTFIRAIFGTATSAGLAVTGNAVEVAQGPHWLQLLAWAGAGVAGILTALGMAVKIYIDIRRYRAERANP